MGWCPICKKNVQVIMKMRGIIGRTCRHIISLTFLRPERIERLIKSYRLMNKPKEENICVCKHFFWKHNLKSQNETVLFNFSSFECLYKRCDCPEFTTKNLKYIENIARRKKRGNV